MPDRIIPITPPLRVVRTIAGIEIRDALERCISLYFEDDPFRRSALPNYWLSADATAVAVWMARTLTDAIERGDVVAVNHVEMADRPRL